MSVALSIAFTGLCALVVDGDRRPAEVLLVDAKGLGEVGGVALPEHAPTLVASLSSLVNAETSSPTRVVVAWPSQGSAAVLSTPGRGSFAAEQVGLWDLTGSEVRIKAQGRERGGVELFQPPNATSSWPDPPDNFNDPASWRDLRFVANMRALAGDARIDATLVGADHAGAGGLPRGVAARIHLDAGRLEAGIPSQAIFRHDVFEFRGAGTEPGLRQALTDTVRWSLETDASAVVIEIVPLAGGTVKRLVLAPNARPHDLFISNLPAENVPGHAHHALSDEEMGALHFGAYYELLMRKPAERPLPRLWFPPVERKATGLSGTILCPPAMFSRH